MDRRRFMKNSTALGLAMAPLAQAQETSGASGAKGFWPGGARLVV